MTVPEHKKPCDCCDPVGDELPPRYNPPGQDEIRYRYGTYGHLLRRMFERLSRYEIPDGDELGKRPLLDLTTRELDDPAIALLDAWAVVGDVLTFYQERIVQEGFLRTANERCSILELARSIGYELGAGVAASTYLAFELKDTEGAPEVATIQAGTQIKSIPPEGELPQTFETMAPITARPEWNTIQPLKWQPQHMTSMNSLVLVGNNLALRTGDVILLYSTALAGNGVMRQITKIVPEGDNTRIHWSGYVNLSATASGDSINLTVVLLRTRASRFGHNAPDWNSLPEDTQKQFPGYSASLTNYPYFGNNDSSTDSSIVDLDTDYPAIVPDAYVVLKSGSNTLITRATSVDSQSRADFALSAKITQLNLQSAASVSTYGRRSTAIYAGSETFELALVPRVDEIWGNVIDVEALLHLPEKGQAVIITGKRPRLRIVPETPLTLKLDDGGTYTFSSASEWLVDEAPVIDDTGTIHFRISNDDGIVGWLSLSSSFPSMQILPSRDTDKPVSEVVIVEEATGDTVQAQLTFEKATRYIYERQSVTLTANVAFATHGETVAVEVLGGGDGSQPNQRFTLKKPPLTHISAQTPDGSETTLEVRVNRVLWHEADSLYVLDADDRGYVTRLDNEGNTTVIFGDGKRGRRLPSGIENVVASYRQGIGLAGNVGAGTLTMLKTRPLGVNGVTNPLPATGGDDPEHMDDARDNAPLTVRTLDRIVSLSDYEDYARAFAGVGKAAAAHLWNGREMQIVVTIADAEGQTVPDDAKLMTNLKASMDKYNDPMHSFTLQTFIEKRFNVEIGIIKHDDYLWDDIEATAKDTLLHAFSFGQRAFGQDVTAAEIIRDLHQIEGIIAVDIDRLYVSGAPNIYNDVLTSEPARIDTSGTTVPAPVLKAELLLINPSKIDLTEKTV